MLSGTVFWKCQVFELLESCGVFRFLDFHFALLLGLLGCAVVMFSEFLFFCFWMLLRGSWIVGSGTNYPHMGGKMIFRGVKPPILKLCGCKYPPLFFQMVE